MHRGRDGDARFRPAPGPAAAADYERVLRPIYGFAYGLAQVRARAAGDPPVRGRLAPDLRPRPRPPAGCRRAAVRAAVSGGIPATVWTLNRLLRTEFDPDLSAAAITRSGIDAATELARRLRMTPPPT